ncbi:MAG: YcnI family protein [Actinomycetota bacterium]
MRKKIAVIGAACALGVLVALPAHAHVTIRPNEAAGGGFSQFGVSVPNERDDASTIRVEVQFPPVFASVSFQDVPGWQRRIEMTTLDEPIEAFGEEITEVVGSVTWSGGEIEPGEFQVFPFSVGPMPEGGTLEFPAIQTYDSGEVVRWIGPADADEPAGTVEVIDLGADEDQGELAALADAREQLAEDAPAAEEDDDGDDDSDMGAILGGAGVGLGAIALVISLLNRRRLP